MTEPIDERLRSELQQHGVWVTSMQELYNWGRKNSIWPLQFGLVCCAIEMIATAASRDVIAGGRGGDHLDRATRQSELKRPNRVLSSPIIKLLHRSHPYTVLLQFASQSFVNWLRHFRFNPSTPQCSQFKHPLPHAQTRPSTRSNRKTNIAMNAPMGKPMN